MTTCLMRFVRTIAVGVLSILTPMGLLAQQSPPAFSPGAQGNFSFSVREGLTLTAELRLPAAEPSGIVVILHGGTGVSYLDQNDVQDLLSQGLATVLVDSFGGRNFRPATGTGAGAAIRPSDRAADAFAVLRALSKHPDLKDKRAVLFGRSHGGAAAMVTATAWAKAMHAPDGPSYIGYIALYPGCNAAYPEQLQANAPIRLHLGALDDLTPAKPCEAAVDRMKAAGIDATFNTYADAHHAFDMREAVQYFGAWVTLRNCNLSLVSAAAPLPMAEISKCATRGATMGSNRTATEAFRKARAKEIAELLQR
jgi:dienelactone hydrolase